MYRKLDEAALGAILEAGIAEFARCGFQPASIAAVAKSAGVSVGVIYKYFGDKDALFLACVRHSLELLDATLQEAAAGGLYPPSSGERVLTSGMLRTEQTLRLIYGEVPHEVWPELREVSFGIFEGTSYDELKGRAEYKAWLAGDWFQNVPPGGESFAQAETRILSALARMQAQEEDILAVVHGGTVLTIMQALFPEEKKTAYDWQPSPGGGYQIDLTAHSYQKIGIQK